MPPGDIDVEALARWLRSHLGDASGVPTLEKFPGGQSNPTYLMTTGTRKLVLRRKPFGVLLPSAHAVEREFGLLSALHPAGIPVPRPVALCEDEGVVGAVFYLMEFADGRTFWNGQLPNTDIAERRPIYHAMVETLAKLHSVDYEAVGLSGFGKPGNYFERQITRWTRQYRAAQTDDIPEVEWLIDWLPRYLPEQARSTIIHGDYRIDNLIYAHHSPEVLAVIDWELATIGDPLADLTYLAMNWVMPANGRSGLLDIDFASLDIPSLEEMLDIYCAATGRPPLPNLHWYFAYNLFRLVGIVQGVKKRMLDGNASSAKAEETVAELVPLARAAWEQARLAGASRARGETQS